MASARICKPGPPLSLLATGPLLAVSLVGSLAAAPTAHADPTDNAFIAALHAHGITHDSPNPQSLPVIWFAINSIWAKRRSRSRPM